MENTSVENKHEWRDQDENLVGRISTSPRYVTDITEPDPLSTGELGGGGVIRKN